MICLLPIGLGWLLFYRAVPVRTVHFRFFRTSESQPLVDLRMLDYLLYYWDIFLDLDLVAGRSQGSPILASEKNVLYYHMFILKR